MDEKYFPEVIEEKWQARWAAAGVFEVEARPGQPKFYCLEMLPYPSGRLHMGHVRNYSIGDALSWFKRLQGFNVLHPIGWDSFGQPAEQAAIKSGINPRTWTEQNIAHMRAQLKKLGISYDWRREIAAHTPEYYQFDQWFFLKMNEKGLVYRKNTQVNWCETCQTTLSNEQASGGLCWRCGNPVTKKDLEQWFVRITDYAEQLLNDMKEIEAGWPEKVLTMQRHWIGRSEGAFVDFPLADGMGQISVFTTRIDTIFGVNALVCAVEHPVIAAAQESFAPAVKEMMARIGDEKLKPADLAAEVEKIGVETGLFAVNPFNQEKIPVWIANYVLIEYGTGAVMSVPSGDQRDFEFARKYGLKFRQIKLTEDGREIPPADMTEADEAWTMTVNTGAWSGLSSREANRQMTEYAEAHHIGRGAVNYKLRDWGVSRQRFWGAPIPIVHCPNCGAVPEKYENLPVRLPESAPFTGTGESPLAKVPEFVNTRCPHCGGAARRETDTMDTFVDSSWYYFRYCDPHNAAEPVTPEIAGYWTPVEQYIGGVEHAVMHLMYTRFWTKFMRDIGLVKFNEPVKRLMTQGMVVAETFYRERADGSKEWFNPGLVEIERDNKGKITSARLISDGQPVAIGAVEKMSKSKNNGVDPDEMVTAYGSDAVRMFILFAAPVENDLHWKEAGIEGSLRFLRRVYNLVWRVREPISHAPAEPPAAFDTQATALRRKTHQTIQRVTNDLERFQMNTSIAALMELSNQISDFKFEISKAGGQTGASRGQTEEAGGHNEAARGQIKASRGQTEEVETHKSNLYAVREALETLTLLLAPFAPHTAEELWEALGHVGGILSAARWPQADAELAKKDELEIPVQINGKLRAKLMLPADISQEEMERAAHADEKVQTLIAGQTVVKTIVVPQRLVNIVVR